MKSIISKVWNEICKLKIVWDHLRVTWWLRYILYITIVIVSLAIWVQMTKDTDTPNRFALGTFNFLNNWALVLSAAATFILAIAAFLAIMDNRYSRIVDKRERLLNEIIKWAVDASKGKIDEDIMALENDIEFARGRAAIDIEEWRNISSITTSKNKYIINIASDLDNELKQTVSKLDELLRERIKLKIPYHQRVKPGWELELPKNKLKIYQVANKVIEEATRIKTK